MTGQDDTKLPATPLPPDHGFELTLRLPPRRAWELLANTEPINRAAGMAPMHYAVEPLPDGTSRRTFTTRQGGFVASGEELQTSWQYPRDFEIRRVFDRGPFVRVTYRVEIEPLDPTDPSAGSRAIGRFWFELRGWRGRLVRWGFGAKVLPKMRAFLLQRDAELHGLSRIGQSLRPSRRTPTEQEREAVGRLMHKARELCPEAPLEPIGELLLEADDVELLRLRPLALRRSWHTDRRATLNAFLAATAAGLLRLRWGVVCPHCRGAPQQHERLDQVGQDGFCPSCNHGFAVDLDRQLEAIFDPHPQVRAVQGPPFCLAGPAMVPHIRYQRMLEPGQEFRPRVDLEQGRYQLRVSGTVERRWLRVEGEAGEDRTIRVTDLGLEGPELDLPAETPTEVTIRNDSGRRVLAVIEDARWGDDALSAAELVADQQFRDLFSAEMLAEGVSLGVQSVTILFTDLVGSTAMYRELGDARAFNLVWNHFDVLTEVVGQRSGAVIKTIGDAIMAAFARPEDALEAAVELHGRLAPHLEGQGHDYPVALKIGVHEGPSIAVTLNERLDYFGTTVNTAARVESLSVGGDIVVTQRLYEVTDDCAPLRSRGWVARPLTAELKGLESPTELQRFEPGQA
jgi:class 3 adenylate cyclase